MPSFYIASKVLRSRMYGTSLLHPTSKVDMFVTASTELWNMLSIVVTPLVLKCSVPPF